MTTDLTQLLRFEIERDVDAGELLNLVQNPSGELGAWGWVTPVAGSVLRSVRDAVYGYELVYTSPGSVASHFYTERMPVAPGQYVAAHWTSRITLSSKYSAQVEWLDEDEVVIGSTTATSLLVGSTDPVAYGSYLAPAGTFYCRLRFDHFATGGGNPPALSAMAVQNVTLTAAATAGALGWTRTNLLPTPNGEHGSGAWGSGAGDIGTSSAQEWAGLKSLTLTKTDGSGSAAAVSAPMAVVGGRDYGFQARSRARTTTRTVTVSARWFKSDGTEIATTKIKSQVEVAGQFTVPIAGVATAPTNAATVRMRVEYGDIADDELHYFTTAMVEQASYAAGYFDGDTADALGITYAWSGTAGASTSVATGPAGDVGTLVPVPYQNILGPTAQIAVDREDLNVGSLTARIFDAILDPTQTDLIKPGRRVRLTTVDGDVVFAGKSLTANVTYHLLENDEHKRAEVNLTAVDPINVLASSPSREGVATIAELPYVLEGAGAPWSCNGSGDQVASADVVAYNDNASALDQVAVTRDSVLGYAWVDRNGVLQAWDRDELDTTVAAVLDEETYTADIDIDFDLDRVINSVSVVVLRVIATSGVTEEVTFGPYVDQDSYQAYGKHHQDYTVQGFDVDDTAGIAAYAQQILDANATPRMRVNSLTLPIQSADDFDKALLDLYDLVTVQNDRAGINENSRLTTLQHQISPGKWLVTVGFSEDGSVAPSTAVPSPPPGVGTIKEETDAAIGDAMQQAVDALAAADAAANFAEALNTVYREPTAPTNPDVDGRALVTNDRWFDSDDSNKPYRWDGSAWVDFTQSWLDTNPTGTFPAVVVSPAGLAAYNSGGTAVTTIDSSDGTLTTTGSVFANGDVNGSTVTGGTVQSTATASRGIKLNSTALIAYNGSGTPTFSITAATGAVAMLGGLVSGADVIADSFATGGSGSTRIEVTSATRNSILYYSGSTFQGSVDGFSSGIRVKGPASPYIHMGATSFNVWAPTVTNGNVTINGNLSVSGSFPSSGSSWVGTATSNLNMASHAISGVTTLSASGDITTGGDVKGAGVYVTGIPVATGGESVFMGASGRLFCHTSPSHSKYKRDVNDIDVNLDSLAQVRRIMFRYRDDVPFDVDDPDEVFYSVPADQVDELGGLDFLLGRDDAGEVHDFKEQRLPLALLAGFADHHPRIAELERRDAEKDRLIADLIARLEALEK